MKLVTKRQGAIALLDRLGSKEAWAREEDHYQQIEKWEKLVEYYKNDFEAEPIPGYNVELRTFSDTVLIFSSGENMKNTLIEMANDLAVFISHAILDGMFFRGCVSVGDYYVSDNLVIGTPIHEASKYFELPEMIGVFASPSTNIALKNISEIDLELLGWKSTCFTSHDIPLKIGIEKDGQILDIRKNDQHQSDFQEFNLMHKGKSFLEILNKEMEKTTDISSTLKLRNTINFLES